MSLDFKWNSQRFRSLEKQIQRHLKQDVASQIQAEKVNPLSHELNQLSKRVPGRLL